MDTKTIVPVQGQVTPAARELLLMVQEGVTSCLIPALTDFGIFREDFPANEPGSAIRALVAAGLLQERRCYVLTPAGEQYLTASAPNREPAPVMQPEPLITALTALNPLQRELVDIMVGIFRVNHLAASGVTA